MATGNLQCNSVPISMGLRLGLDIFNIKKVLFLNSNIFVLGIVYVLATSSALAPDLPFSHRASELLGLGTRQGLPRELSELILSASRKGTH